MQETTLSQESNEIKSSIKLNKNSSKILKIGRILLNVILVLFVAYVIIAFDSFFILTDSMEPIIDVENTVIINRYSPIDKLDKYDIIAFYADLNDDGTDEVVVHYVYSIEETNGVYSIRTVRHNIDEETNTTIFDLSEQETVLQLDEWTLSKDDFVGKLKFVIKNNTFGSFLLFSSSTIGRIVLVIDLIVIYIIIEMFSTPDKKRGETVVYKDKNKKAKKSVSEK